MTVAMAMPAGLRCAMTVTDLLTLAYWLVIMPVGVVFSLTGLAAVQRSHSRRPWHGLAIVSLTLTMCAGVMAIGYCAIFSDFDPGWWLLNLVVLFGLLVWLPRLIVRAG